MTVTQISIYTIHHDPAIWPRAEEFLPQRFLPQVILLPYCHFAEFCRLPCIRYFARNGVLGDSCWQGLWVMHMCPGVGPTSMQEGQELEVLQWCSAGTYPGGHADCM